MEVRMVRFVDINIKHEESTLKRTGSFLSLSKDGIISWITYREREGGLPRKKTSSAGLGGLFSFEVPIGKVRL